MATDKRLTIRFDNGTLQKLDRIASVKKQTIPEAIRELISDRSTDLDAMQEQLKQHSILMQQLTSAIEKQTKALEINNEIYRQGISECLERVSDVTKHLWRVIKVQFCHYNRDEKLTWKEAILKRFPSIINKPDEF